MSDQIDHISKYFTIHESLWLPSWKRLATEADGLNVEIQSNLVMLFQKMDIVREHFNLPIRVHCAFRPDAYNLLVNGVRMSPHLTGEAVDFDVMGMDCNKAKIEILNAGLLEKLEMRMERNTGNWIHLDIRYVKPEINRFFIP